MEKEITYKEQKYTMQIEWGGSLYCFRIIGVTGFHSIPFDCLNDIEKIKPYIIKAMEDRHELYSIEKWDGKI